MKKFMLYFLRWELSTIVLAPCIWLLPFNPLIKTIIANGIGACIFFWADQWIFKKKPKKNYNFVI